MLRRCMRKCCHNSCIITLSAALSSTLGKTYVHQCMTSAFLDSSSVVAIQRRIKTDATVIRIPHKYEQFAYMDNSDFLDSLLQLYSMNKQRVDPSWWPIFQKFEECDAGAQGTSADKEIGVTVSGEKKEHIKRILSPDEPFIKSFKRPSEIDANLVGEKERLNGMKLAWIIRAFEFSGHLLSKLDPLGRIDGSLAHQSEEIKHIKGFLNSDQLGGSTNNALTTAKGMVDATSQSLPSSSVSDDGKGDVPQLNYNWYHFTQEDLDKTIFYIKLGASFGAMVTCGNIPMTLRQIIDRLKTIYCGNIGFEFMHSGFYEIRNWFREEIIRTLTPVTALVRRRHLKLVVDICEFEEFLHKKWGPCNNYFGLAGSEAVVLGVKSCINTLAQKGMKECYVAMGYRGRLALEANVCNKNLETIFDELMCEKKLCRQSKTEEDVEWIADDSLYHLDYSNDIDIEGGKKVNVRLFGIPSHLETVNTVVLGHARRRQWDCNDKNREQVVPIIIHGEAAFAGQGLNYELMTLSDLENFSVGGAIHFIINNQIGFTTEPRQSRGSLYASDMAKVNSAPVIHVNGNNVDEVMRAASIAAAFRQTFHRDVVIDIICYRRYGHSESDIPEVTQPEICKEIAKQPRLDILYGKTLYEENVVSKQKMEEYHSWYVDKMEAAYKRIESTVESMNVKAHDKVNTKREKEQNRKKYVNNEETFLQQPYTSLKEKEEWFAKSGRNDYHLKNAANTGLNMNTLIRIGLALTNIPEYIKLHPKADVVIRLRRESMLQGKDVEWCLAESLALGSLACEGFNVRLTGQDVERGTFSQRHAVLTDTVTNKAYLPLADISKDQGCVAICNSSLSEYGVSGYEAGYATENYNSFIMWEAQFGDFANGSQIIFDKYLSCQESKFKKTSCLCISLPHGYDGQGPEHSSARIERYLQLSVESMSVPADFNAKLHRGSQELNDLMESRIEGNNWQVCYPSRPANYFHLLRRQVHRNFRKPLIFFFSKSGLRAANSSSTLAEMGPDTCFQSVYPIIFLEKKDQKKYETLPLATQGSRLLMNSEAKARALRNGVGYSTPEIWQECTEFTEKGGGQQDFYKSVKRVLLCSGQVERKVNAMVTAARKFAPDATSFSTTFVKDSEGKPKQMVFNDTVLILLEQIAPFPWERVAQELIPFLHTHQCNLFNDPINPEKGTLEICWLQEEHRNAGAWTFVRTRINNLVQYLIKHYYEEAGSSAEVMKAGWRFRVKYIGRDVSASPSTGLEYVHADEDVVVFEETFDTAGIPEAK